MWDDFVIDMGVAALLRMLKDGKKAKKWQRAMLKVFGAIAAAYRTEQEFHQAADRELNQ